jgi:NTP pyrophosphatase (non-canonical NTP hydrolase)
MDPTEYAAKVLATESMDFDKIRERLNDNGAIRLLHTALGLASEAGEFVDALKKHLFYGKEIDAINLLEELGDHLWYIGIGLNELGFSMEEGFARNIAKLQERYKGKFGETQAENRDLDAERKTLETPSGLVPDPEGGPDDFIGGPK